MRHSVDRPLHLPAHPSRRVILHGAAWAVPAVALVAATPAFAASGTTLSFSAASYSGVTCGTITTAVVRAANGAAAAVGVTIALQLSGGYTFDGGGTSATVVTGSDGSVSCGTIHVPGNGATGTLSASSSGAASASASLTASDARILTSPSGLANVTSVPVGSTPVGLDYFLAGGVLYKSGTGAVATGISAVGRLVESPSGNSTFLLPVRRSDGSAAVFSTSAGTLTAVSGTPSGATPLAADLFLSGSSLYRGGVAVATDVAQAGQLISHDAGSGSSNKFFLPYRSTVGSARILRLPDNDVRTAPEYGTANGPGGGATPIADDLFLSSGNIYRVSWDGTSAYGTGLVASGIAAFGTLTPNPYYAGERLLPVRRSGTGEAALFMVSGNAVRTASNVPTGCTPLGADLFALNGAIYQDASGRVANSVSAYGTAAPASFGSNKVSVPFTVSTSSC
ncbi:hypothetical protein M3667_00795 [Microbacterium sp. P26]|uniref:hypothetical protein n=1 Tax=Microbacterium TaxID=33882 RepID=UPI00203DC904|nr:hypothetical protein [Microbacterium sp. P26]MCM3500412.1 hypothetical protein [Microbacterium sp. P26]